MKSHYFKNDSNLSDELNLIEKEINGKKYRFYTDSGVFSKRRLDFGTILLIETLLLNLKNEGKFLDLGSGYGPIGITVKKEFPKLVVHSTDVNEKAVLLTEKNSSLNQVEVESYLSDGFLNITENFNIISLNPPIRTGKETVFRLYDEVYENLIKGGSFWIVIRKKQGAESHIKYLKKLFSNLEIIKKRKGYYVIHMQKA